MMRMLAVLLACAPLAANASEAVLHETIVALRSGTEPEYVQFAGRQPAGRDLRVSFESESNAAPHTLFLFQDDVKLDWRVELNGRRLGNLFLMEAPLVHHMVVPAGALREGANELAILPPKDNDDIRLGNIRLRSGAWPAEDPLLELSVRDGDRGERSPARLTIVDGDGTLSPLAAEPGQRLAVRPGVVYTGDGTARVRIPPGEYTIYATRGFEYGLAREEVRIVPGTTVRLGLEIRREVPTPGWVSCDTHTHTFTFSRHGDATLEERVLALAGEGIELPVATDHNILTEYSGAAERMGVARYFTPVVGNEVTTQTAHFNAFPMELGSRVPNFRLPDWGALLESIRQTPGVRVVILNHPHNIHNKFEPFAPEHFDAKLGLPRGGLRMGFDAIELVNSSALQTDWWQIFEDWFALLNAGERIVGVGSSDVHDVSRYIVGQGRTYLRCADENPGSLDVNAACDALLQGRALVSMGLLTHMTVNDRFGVGDLARGLGESIDVEVRVFGPGWVEASRLELFANGVLIREADLPPTRRGGEKAKVRWTLPKLANDIHLIAVATGPPVTDLYWAIPRPYQPRSPVWEPKVIGCTNPIWVDWDGDGEFTSARQYARRLVREHGENPGRLAEVLKQFDAPVADHAASLR